MLARPQYHGRCGHGPGRPLKPLAPLRGLYAEGHHLDVVGICASVSRPARRRAAALRHVRRGEIQAAGALQPHQLLPAALVARVGVVLNADAAGRGWCGRGAVGTCLLEAGTDPHRAVVDLGGRGRLRAWAQPLPRLRRQLEFPQAVAGAVVVPPSSEDQHAVLVYNGRVPD